MAYRFIQRLGASIDGYDLLDTGRTASERILGGLVLVLGDDCTQRFYIMHYYLFLMTLLSVSKHIKYFVAEIAYLGLKTIQLNSNLEALKSSKMLMPHKPGYDTEAKTHQPITTPQIQPNSNRTSETRSRTKSPLR